ncbi:MAG: signal recognition particle-docking protein FtsY [Chloroherpetonaceae bacterium]|nr:signal recognition particle-docking protein FtsY [Chloroherpetonaceae bacterium]MCS7211229.1 signal recognition particle-docking protein FtsY [Chloroherpetonaceae bacterium]MDW8019242.1 signal recognition particle-docking protein FtsY [Chloroherpetonaceae bacterium]
MGFFDAFKLSRLKEGLKKTRENLSGKIARLVKGKTKIDDEFLEELEQILIAADVGVQTTLKIVEAVAARAKKERYMSEEELQKMVRSEIQKMLIDARQTTLVDFDAPIPHKPYVIMIVGVNGVGKTTTIGKLAHHYKQAGKSVLIAAADTFRAAATEQLEIWAERAGVPIVAHGQGGDPSAVVFDAISSALAKKTDIVLIDTAGRLHNKTHLMEELAKIKRVIKKKLPSAPDEVLLVLDGSTGQNALNQAKEFTKVVEVTGLVLTKLDGTAKGGVVIAISNELNIPVKYIGVGEQIDDLQIFDREKFAEALFE